MAERTRAQATAAQARKFGFTVGIAFGALGGVLLWRDRATLATVAWVLGGLLIAGALVAPRALMPVERAWMAMARGISKVTTPIVMGIVYFLVVFPIGFLVRTFGKNPIVRQSSGGSYWVVRSRESVRGGGMERQF